MSKLNSKLYNAPTDQYGKEIQFDVREDEEQQKKFQETVELLVAAGYFRARIKGLSAFDKIVGGMTWCITTCNFDVDVDLLFQESSTIGQKIALVEKIVSVLPRMKCPHGIEPHQIQGLDFIHVYPVIQWLVKKAIETRAEMGDLNRSFALSKFQKINEEVLAEAELVKQQTALRTLTNLKESNAPQRKYIRRDLDRIADRQIRVQSTLLEYGQQNILLSNIISQQEQQKQQQAASAKVISPLKQQADPDQQASLEEANLKRLINEMSATDNKQNKVTASAVGQILGLQQSALQQIVSEYTSKENVLQLEIESLEKLMASGEGGLGGGNKQRLINFLVKQIEQKEASLHEKKAEFESVQADQEKSKQKLSDLKDVENTIRQELAKIEDMEKNTDKKSVEQLQELVTVNDGLKQKEQDYKKSCKDELASLESEIEKLKEYASSGDSDDTGTFNKINDQYEATLSKLKALKLKVAKRNREISTLKRKLDETPSRNELTQYQKRFIELYNQMSAVHTQTKQFYILYNSLEDKKMYMNKQINLFNSVHDQFAQAMSTQSNREQFVKQLEYILDGIKINLNKVDSKKNEEKSSLDQLNDKYASLIEKRRLYYKTLKDFQEECKKNELLAK